MRKIIFPLLVIGIIILSGCMPLSVYKKPESNKILPLNEQLEKIQPPETYIARESWSLTASGGARESDKRAIILNEEVSEGWSDWKHAYNEVYEKKSTCSSVEECKGFSIHSMTTIKRLIRENNDLQTATNITRSNTTTCYTKYQDTVCFSGNILILYNDYRGYGGETFTWQATIE